MKFSKGQTIFLSIASVLLLATIAYSLFLTTLSVSGSAGTSGQFNVKFTSATITDEYKSENAEIILAADGKTVTITATGLKEPGAYATFSVKVENLGSVDAKLKTVNLTPTQEDNNIKVTHTAPAVDSLLDAGNSVTFTVTVIWDGDSVDSTDNYTFNLALDYEQNV